MSLQFDRILLQSLMVIIPIVLYSTLKKEKGNPQKESIILGIVCSACILLSILFAVRIDQGIFLDMRMVPWFLSFIYGGNLAGVIVTVFFFVIRFLFGGNGMIPAYLVILLCFFVINFFQKGFTRWSRNKKTLLSAFFIIVSTALLPTIGSILLNVPVSKSNLMNYMFFIILNGVAGWVSIHLMESYREKRTLMDELHKNEKMSIVGQLAASVAHEIRNPMTSVRGFIQLLKLADNITTDQKAYLKVCLDELDRANDIITDYLTLGKSPEPILIKRDISNEVLKSVKSLSSYATLKGVNLSVQIDQPAMVLCIPERVQQMFINIIKNAIEAVGSHGNVTIRQQLGKEKVIFEIRDDGEGMSQDQIRKLGLPYYSTKEKGTGLGLMVTVQIVKEMGGEWEVQSKVKSGTIFKLAFPLVPSTNLS